MIKRFLLLTFLINIFYNALANSTIDSKLDNSLKSNLKIYLPEVSIDKITATPVDGLYQVISGRKVFYIDKTGNYAIIGNLVNLATKQSITEQQIKLLNLVDISQLPLNIAIQRVVGNGSKKLIVFTDPDCPFCKQLEANTLANLKDVTIYYFLYPLAMHIDATNKSKKILCSQDPAKALLDWMTDSKQLASNIGCKNATKLDKMIEVGRDVIQVDSTPTIILENGSIISGMVPYDYLNQLMIEAIPAKNANQ